MEPSVSHSQQNRQGGGYRQFDPFMALGKAFVIHRRKFCRGGVSRIRAVAEYLCGGYGSTDAAYTTPPPALWKERLAYIVPCLPSRF